MSTRTSQRSYSRSALELWFDRLTLDWEPHFNHSLLEAGREVYRQGDARSVELDDETAIVYFKKDKIEHYICVEWQNNRPAVRSSTSEDYLGKVLGIAGLYEIEELVADEMAELILLVEDNGPAPAEQVERAASPVAVVEKPPLNEKQARTLEVSLSADTQGVRLQAFWREGKQAHSAFGQSQAAHELTEGEREKLIGLTSKIRKAGFTLRQSRNDYLLRDVSAIPHFLQKIVPVWRERYTLAEDPKLSVYALGERSISVELKVDQPSAGELDLACRFRLNGSLLSESDSMQLLTRGRQTVMIPGVGMLRTTPEQSSWLGEWRSLLDDTGNGRVPAYMLFSLFGQDYLKLTLTPELTEWHQRLLNAPHLNGHLPDFLRPYQQRGVVWMQHLGSRGCHPLLADEMGLGKTLQVLTVLAEALRSGSLAILPQLVVCPASVVPVWEAEAKRFFPDLRVEVLRSGHDFCTHTEPCLWVSSYTQLRRHKSLLDKARFGYAVLDEAQFIKNPDAKISQSCFSIKSERRLAITGTPLENRLLDLWTIFRFLMPGLLGTRKRMEDESRSDLAAIASRVQQQIEPFVLRRTKADVLSDLPPKMEMALPCPLSPAQEAEYRRLTQDGVGRLGETLNHAMQEQPMSLFALLTRLRQVACDPGLLPWMDAPLEQSGKLRTLTDKLAEIVAAGRKVVVFSQFVTFLERARTALQQTYPDLPLYELTGSSRDRSRPVDDFQKQSGAAVILVSLKAGGTGITLHAADYVFLLDPWWNPAVEQQAIDRVHRIGQDRQVFVYRLITLGTVEERIEALKREKSHLFETTVGRIADLSDLQDHYRSLSELIALPGAMKAD